MHLPVIDSSIYLLIDLSLSPKDSNRQIDCLPKTYADDNNWLFAINSKLMPRYVKWQNDFKLPNEGLLNFVDTHHDANTQLYMQDLKDIVKFLKVEIEMIQFIIKELFQKGKFKNLHLNLNGTL